MEKQELFSNESNIIKKEKDKFNLVSTFLTKFIFGENFDILKKTGYKNSFVSDPNIDQLVKVTGDHRLLYLLFKDKRLTLQEFERIVMALNVIPVKKLYSYELVNDYCMVVVEFPKEYAADYDIFLKGIYSKLSESFKVGFPETKEVFNNAGKRLGKEYTIYYHIFNKTQWLKNFWMERLGFSELDDKLELWESPKNEDLFFNISKII